MILIRGYFCNPSYRRDILPGPVQTDTPKELSRNLGKFDVMSYMDNMEPRDISAANKCLHEWLYPWIDYTHDQHMKAILRLEDKLRLKNPPTREDEMSLAVRRILHIESQSGANIASVENYMEQHKDADTVCMRRSLKDLQNLGSRVKALPKQAQAVLDWLVSNLSLEDSGRSLEQSITTKRLTQLAYVFLPLSFSTSVFGMNISELQHTPMRTFVVTTILLLFAGLLALYYLGWWYRPISVESRVHSAVRKSELVSIIFKFFLCCPKQGIWVMLFALSHRPSTTYHIVCYLELSDIFHKRTQSSWYYTKGPLSGIDAWGAKYWNDRLESVQSHLKHAKWPLCYSWKKRPEDEIRIRPEWQDDPISEL